MAGKKKRNLGFDSVFDKVIAEMRAAQEKVNSQVGQWASKAESELQLDKAVQNVLKRLEDLQSKQIENMQKWQKDMEKRFNAVLDFQKAMLDSLIPGASNKIPGLSSNSTTKTTAKKTSARKTSAKKATAKKSSAKKTTAKKAAVKKSAVSKTTAKKATAKKTTAKKASAKKTAPRKTAAKKAPQPIVAAEPTQETGSVDVQPDATQKPENS